MKSFVKENWKFILFVVIAGLFAGYFTSIYAYDSFTDDMLSQLNEQNVSRNMYITVGTIQVSLLYGLLLSVVGIILSKKVGLWKQFKIDKKALLTTVLFCVIGGLLLYPGDSILFGSIDMVKESYTQKPTFSYIMTSLLYGGIVEEVMMRLFFMSLIVFVISKLFCKKEKDVPTKVYVISNVIAALAFAAGHIPATMMLTSITPMVLVRCFVMNGAYSLAFGHLYRKYGIGYSMICHGLCHLISKVLMLIFI